MTAMWQLWQTTLVLHFVKMLLLPFIISSAYSQHGVQPIGHRNTAVTIIQINTALLDVLYSVDKSFLKLNYVRNIRAHFWAPPSIDDNRIILSSCRIIDAQLQSQQQKEETQEIGLISKNADSLTCLQKHQCKCSRVCIIAHFSP